MNREQVLGQIRHFLTLLAGVFGANGFMDGQTGEFIMGVIAFVIGAGWSWFAKTELYARLMKYVQGNLLLRQADQD